MTETASAGLVAFVQSATAQLHFRFGPTERKSCATAAQRVNPRASSVRSPGLMPVVLSAKLVSPPSRLMR